MNINEIKKMTDTALTRFVKGETARAVDSILMLSHALVEMDKRGIPHTETGFLAHYRDIASGRLDPKTILCVELSEKRLEVLRRLPTALEVAIATHQTKVPVAYFNDKNEKVMGERSFASLNNCQIDRSFTQDGKIRSAAAQKRLLGELVKPTKKKQPLRITANLRGAYLEIGDEPIIVKPSQLKKALSQLGYKLEKV